MSYKNIILSFVSILSLGVIFSYGLVFAGPMVDNPSYKVLSKNIFPDSLDLKNNKIFIYSKDKAENFSINADCNISSQHIGSNKNIHAFTIGLNESNCYRDSFSVVMKNESKTMKIDFTTIKAYDLYNRFLDYSDDKINSFSSSIDSQIKKYNLSLAKNQDSMSILQSKRKIEELQYLKRFLSNIIVSRKAGYKIPVLGSKLTTNLSKIPNAGRGYRKSYTDGIHHGWDFDANKGDSVIALDDGIIIRVVDKFEFSDLGQIVKGNNLSYEQKLKNLDVLRGKQVWLKTMKGDVAFYSHLDEVFTDVKEGMIVSKGKPLGTIGITGVPQKDYDDYHLHIAIQKNPYVSVKAGKYTFLDYMKWDWYFKGKPIDYILKHQEDMFEK